MAADNKSLGKFVLDGIPPAPRGVPQIEVTFDIDANGILQVTARDKATGRSQNITITASSGLSEAEVDQMRRDAEAHAEDDRKRHELIEARNHADNLIYTAEKAVRDLGDKVPEDVRSDVEAGVQAVRSATAGEDAEAIKKATDELGQVIQKIGSAAYASQPEAEAAAQQPGADEAPAGGNAAADGDDVVDGEFKQV